jgi:hypothetical protein
MQLFHHTSTLADISWCLWQPDSTTLAVFLLHLELVLPPLEIEKNDTSNQKGTRKSQMICLRRMGSYIGEGKWKLEEANKKSK